MKDIQKTKPDIIVGIQKVGIQNLKLPISILQQNYFPQQTVADIDVFVDIDKNAKGIHMSRLIEYAQKSAETILSNKTIEKVSKIILESNNATRSEISFKFPYFIKKKSPVSKKDGIIYSNVEMLFINHENKENESFLSVETISTSLCPCSKEISNYGAHNQRSIITILGKHKKDNHFWIEDIIKIIEENSSCEIYSVLKRPDEKFVTEKAYKNPNFVEDSARKIYQSILNENKFSEFTVKVINEESIHLHNAVAILSYKEEF